MPSLKPCVIAVVSLAALIGCRTAGGARPQAPAAPLPDALQAWVGQGRFLAGAGEAKSLALKNGESLPKGDCDIAVEVRSIGFDKGIVSLSLETLGRAEVAGRMRGRECREVPPVRTLTVSSLASAEDALPALERLLATPEAHLAARDVSFDLAPEKKGPKLAAAPSDGDGTAEERALGRQVNTWPNLLLAVHPLLSGPARHQGEMEFAGAVGVDGRLYKPVLLTALGQGQEERVLKIFPLWRYEPAKRGEERIAARVRGRATLTIR